MGLNLLGRAEILEMIDAEIAHYEREMAVTTGAVWTSNYTAQLAMERLRAKILQREQSGT